MVLHAARSTAGAGNTLHSSLIALTGRGEDRGTAAQEIYRSPRRRPTRDLTLSVICREARGVGVVTPAASL